MKHENAKPVADWWAGQEVPPGWECRTQGAATDTPQPLRTIELKRRDFSVRYGKDGHVVKIACAHPLTDAAQDVFKMAQGLADGECLVFDRQAKSLGVFELEQALRLDASEFIIIHRPSGSGVGNSFTGEKQ